MTVPASPDPSLRRPPSRTVFLGLVLLALAATLWAVFLWFELIEARAGGEPFCAFGDGANCGELWDGPFASAVQGITGLPVAGWGVVWGMVALGLSGFLLLNGPRLWPAGGRAETPAAGGPAWIGAVRLTAWAGIAGVVVLVAATVIEGVFCAGCLITDVLTLSWAVLALGALRGVPGSWGRGALLAAGATVVVFLALLVPGLATPESAGTVGERALSDLEASGALEGQPEVRMSSPAGSAPQQDANGGTAGQGSVGEGTGDANRDLALRQLVGSPDPRVRQLLANSLADYRRADATVPLREPRAVIGQEDAPVRITTFSDPLCPACANLHGTLSQIRGLAYTDDLALEERWFPLDGSCNPRVERQEPGGLRCLGAKLAICLEGLPGAFEYAGDMFGRQRTVTAPELWDLASRHRERAELEACVASEETGTALADDIAWAQEHDIHGTPLILINGRQGPAFPAFLYALVLSEGRLDHPAFSELPPPGAM